MIDLIEFAASDFEIFKSWINNEEELFQFAGPIFSFPLTDDQLVKYLNLTDIRPLKVVLQESKETIGHCEFNFENNIPRLSRILVGNKELRGRGIGQNIVKKMVEELFRDEAITKVDLNVFSWNTAAIKCYEKIGFRINHEITDEFQVNGLNWTRLNMELDRDDF